MIRVKNPKVLLFLTIAAALIFGSCASKPPAPAPEPAPVVTPAPEPAPEPKAPEVPAVSQAELDALLAQAKALKKKSFDLKLFEVLPDDYKASEGVYASAFAAYDAATKDPKQAQAAKDALGGSVASYTALIDKGVVALAKAKRDNADAMKAGALKAGADAKSPERFEAAGKEYDAAAALMDGGKHEDSIAVFERARLYYELSYKRSIAGDLRGRIGEKDYAKWDSGNFQLAEGKYAAEDGLWASGTGDRAAGVDMLDESILRFNLVVQKGRQMVATGSKEKTDDSKAKSEQIKAQVAVKDQYQSAVGVYDDGVSKLAAGNYEDAAAAFDQAREAFDAAYAAAADKRAKAQAAMDSAAAAAADSARKADEADAIVGQPKQ